MKCSLARNKLVISSESSEIEVFGVLPLLLYFEYAIALLGSSQKDFS